MESPLKPLQLFVERYGTMLTRMDSSKVHDLDDTEKHTSTTSPTTFLRTTYGLQINVANTGNDTGAISIHAEQCLSSKNKQEDKMDDATMPYHYRLLPDWQTSYLWYNTLAGNYGDSPVVDDETIDIRYPELAAYYWPWHEVYEKAFGQLDCLGTGENTEVFPDIRDRVGWEVGGFLIACWLAMQHNVGSVEYTAHPSKYLIRKENLDSMARKFLEDQNDLLREFGS